MQGISNIIFINYISGSGGANSGEYYLFFDTKKLHKVVELNFRADIGLLESESLCFPTDSLGVKDKIIYVKEEIDTSENETGKSDFEWEKSSKIKLKLEWINNSLIPDPKSITNNEHN